MNVTIRTNNHKRQVLNRWELTAKESAEFDYLAEDEGQFFRFKGTVYDLGEFSRITHPMECQAPEFQGWDIYLSDSYFSGVLIKYADDFESVIVAQYFS